MWTEFGSETYKVLKTETILNHLVGKREADIQKKLAELKTILLKYPYYHKIIRKRLNIPIDTWNKLKREVEMLKTNKRILTWRRNEMYRLSDKEKEFVQRLLIPATTFLAINKI